VMSETEPLYALFDGSPPSTPSTPGHHQVYEAIGDVRLVHQRLDGTLAGVLLSIDTGELMEIAVMARTWPPGVAVGTRLYVRGHLQRETMERKNSHFVLATHVNVVVRPPRRAPA
jgi:hypothetical protein